jgi:hypothetical protein
MAVRVTSGSAGISPEAGHDGPHPAFGQDRPRRWAVERTFGWLVRNRRLARDYERLTDNFESMIKIAMIRLMATSLAGETVRWSNRAVSEAA